MHVIYDSEDYCVVEFPAQSKQPEQGGSLALEAGGYEIVAKNLQRELFVNGAMAEQFRAYVQKLIKEQPTNDDVDAFLGQFDSLMHHPVVLH